MQQTLAPLTNNFAILFFRLMQLDDGNCYSMPPMTKIGPYSANPDGAAYTAHDTFQYEACYPVSENVTSSCCYRVSPQDKNSSITAVRPIARVAHHPFSFLPSVLSSTRLTDLGCSRTRCLFGSIWSICFHKRHSMLKTLIYI
jgi:hypothetical protein